MRPIRTDETIGIYGAPPGLEDVVSGLPYWREKDPDTGGALIRSVWALDADEKEAIALGGNVILGILGEPIPPVQLAVLSPIDVPAFGMDPDPRYLDLEDGPTREEFIRSRRAILRAAGDGDHHDAGLVRFVLLGYGLIALVLVVFGFLLGRITA